MRSELGLDCIALLSFYCTVGRKLKIVFILIVQFL